MYTIVGVDPASTKCVAVILRDGGYEIRIHKTKSKDADTRCLEAFRWMRKLVREEDAPTIVYLERPVFGRGGLKALLPLGEIQGSLLAGARSAGARVVRVTPPQWKMNVLGKGKGNASKLKIKMHLKKTWPAFYADSNGDIDVCDAGAIALHGKKEAAKEGRRARLVGSPGDGSPGRRVVSSRPRKGLPTLAKN